MQALSGWGDAKIDEQPYKSALSTLFHTLWSLQSNRLEALEAAGPGKQSQPRLGCWAGTGEVASLMRT